MAAFIVLVAAVGWATGLLLGDGPAGLLVALVVAGTGTVTAWWGSDAIALRVSRARPAGEIDCARLHNLVEGLCIAGGLPKPRLYLVDDDAPNAFATGRDPRHAAVAVTTGLLAKLNRVELEGVLAHELSHIKNYDTLVSTLAVTLVGAVILLSDVSLRFLERGAPGRGGERRVGRVPAILLGAVGAVLLLVAPLVGRMMRVAVSGRRELLADLSGISLTRYPPGLLAALEKLREERTVVESASRATAHLWIESPLARAEADGRTARLNRLFDTNPPLEERISALREL